MTSRGPIAPPNRLSVETTRPLESVTTFTPLGLRFWDMVTEEPIRTRLNVVARACPGSGRAIASFTNASGVHAFRGLPGLHDLEFPGPTAAGASAESPPAAPPSFHEPRAFVVSVDDPGRQFNPATVVVPAPFRGLVGVEDVVADCASHPAPATSGSISGSPTPIYLSSSPTRTLPPGTAQVRAQLRARTGAPAADAVLDLEIARGDGTSMRAAGTSDANGTVLVAFPYPPFATTTSASPPPGEAGSALETQCWDVTARVLHEPDALVRLGDAPAPTLTSVFAQAATTVWLTTSTSAISLTQPLCFGSELLLTTADHDRPELLVGATTP